VRIETGRGLPDSGETPASAFPSPEKLLDGVACAGIFCGNTNGDSDPLLERWKRPRDLDTFSNQLRRDYFVRLSGLEDYESPGIRAAAPERVSRPVQRTGSIKSHAILGGRVGMWRREG
jgi:hypothetical protein